MLWTGREVATKIFGKTTEEEIVLKITALRVLAESGKVEATQFCADGTWYYLTDGQQIFRKEKEKKKEVGRLVGLKK